MVVHLLIQTRFHYLPESVAVVIVGKNDCNIILDFRDLKCFHLVVVFLVARFVYCLQVVGIHFYNHCLGTS